MALAGVSVSRLGAAWGEGRARQWGRNKATGREPEGAVLKKASRGWEGKRGWGGEILESLLGFFL